MSTDEIYLRKALGLIDAGVWDWKCPSIEDPQYAAFQSITESILEAKNEGLIYEAAIERSRSRNSYMHITRAIIAGGLTPKGKRRLADLSKLTPSTNEIPQDKKVEILQLKPSIYGIGIDLKALWKLLRSKVKSRV